ncbi:Clathrin adaptor complexes medium subunit family protein isoform 1 [Hibiscus syriacus]|uniref:Clathrin adaptor complexes medium subunit family protein isoform 1 n=1 Tax=Hibiscus syriacus TaxID=106335 RepID=A0A6A2XKP9_HIBSY|nr:Clathrin adaptor complexes medium subunit family protein isoform 1 [Hibiscus syriacus]
MMSYISNADNLCWLMPELDRVIRRLHRVVGNAVVDDDRFIIVGNGSTQIFHALLYALSSPDQPEPISVVAAALSTRHIRRRRSSCDRGCINGQGRRSASIRWSLHRGGDFAQQPRWLDSRNRAGHDAMLFTFSKATGHAGSRIGWAIVKDKAIAAKMVKFIELSSIGVSKESQLRAVKILGVIDDDCRNPELEDVNFFEYGRRIMSDRWEKLRRVVIKTNGVFNLPEYPQHNCKFTGEYTHATPAFAWLRCKEGLNCEELLREKCKIMTRGGTSFGGESTYTRVNMLSSDAEFTLCWKGCLRSRTHQWEIEFMLMSTLCVIN